MLFLCFISTALTFCFLSYLFLSSPDLYQVLLEQEVLHCSLLACCLEVVLFAYSSQRTFPWILDIFQIQPFYFYKVQNGVLLHHVAVDIDVYRKKSQQTVKSFKENGLF